jgi:HEAT repeat protein
VLGWIGPDTLPELSRILTNYHEPEIRFSTLLAIDTMGAKAVPAVPALLPCVNDENEMVARKAINVLRRLGGRQQPVFGALTNLLQSRPALRGETLDALVSFGDEALPVLLKGLQGANLGTHYIAGNTFIRASPEVLTNAALLSMVAAELHSPDPEARDWAARMLRAADGQSSFAKPQHLADLVESHGSMSQIRNEATNALRRLAPQLLRSGPPLIGALCAAASDQLY